MEAMMVEFITNLSSTGKIVGIIWIAIIIGFVFYYVRLFRAAPEKEGTGSDDINKENTEDDEK